MAADAVDRIFDKCYSLYSRAEKAGTRLLEGFYDSAPEASENRDIRASENALQTLWKGIKVHKMAIGAALGLATGAVALYHILPRFLPGVPQHLAHNDQRCVLILGNMQDPITRSIAMDLYRRGFIIFVCSEQSSGRNDDESLFHINRSELPKFIEFLQNEDLSFQNIVVVPNSAYYPSSQFTTLSTKAVKTEIDDNFLGHLQVLSKLFQHVPTDIQIVLLTPSLSLNFGLPCHAPEIFVASFTNSLYKVLRAEFPRANVFLGHLGVLQIAGSPSNYKYLSYAGANISDALLTPLYRLVYSKNTFWLRIWEKIVGSVRFFGKGSRTGLFFGNWLPIGIIRYLF
ncbi:LAMI_0A06348g1_1 [Lachancea mirantina]|uniref:LAMI_0A06348g1_1 n=1 Tax=Lachancea mirantina TaxID=1230905 RepID=A0A1G4IQ43_9SACH|nr:LAMI_0A06348g1_1 [Lachancea mirantina]